MALDSFDKTDVAVVVGASGAIGAAISERLEGHFKTVLRLSRSSRPQLDLADEATIAEAADHAAGYGDLRLVVDATGFLHQGEIKPEKSLRALSVEGMEANFRVNAMGPALLMKHFLRRMPREGKVVFATLSAKVGSIGDNRLGGWYSYRASKAALNQFVRTAAIEWSRTHRQSICVALHPGTVESGLSGPFAKSGLTIQQPDESAAAILALIDRLTPEDTGSFLDRSGERLPW
ncbi:SDR family NAD(P)-dependent oxidoreductase [Nitratireductor basaltis]|uniref:Short-chain dehydrogenase/reductase SDR n=1 Tax=Nitratireductor basaltis TaxID=472175 RepID=A0A084U9L6_9HYPH|nr:SDR family NAD(P)-dependent oxidoreductase [Nitratireductor basaltis]KFB09652.1 Short-chain dehydrogenase/reductase SDR [Nitratireductor basaltis]